MKVLLLRQKEESQKKFCETLKNAGDEVVHLNEDIFSNNYKIENFDFIICFGYRRLIPNKMVEKFNNKIRNNIYNVYSQINTKLYLRGVCSLI